MDWKDRVVLVTGASRGIGSQLAVDLVAAGARTAALARSVEGLRATRERARPAPDTWLSIPCDVTDARAVQRAVERVVATFGRVDVLVSNAGIGTFTSPVEASLESMRRVMEVNLWGGVHAVKAVLPHMIPRRSGHVVFVGSVGGKHAFPRQGAYSASKFALQGFAESLALDLEAVGIGITIVNPGPVDTPFFLEEGLEELRGVSGRMAIPAARVSAAILKAVHRGRREVTVPGHLRLPCLAHALLPGLFHRGLRLFARRNGILWQPRAATLAGAPARKAA